MFVYELSGCGFEFSCSHPDLIFVVAYAMHKQGDPSLGSSHSACGYTSMRFAKFSGTCNVLEIPNKVVFEEYFDRVVKK